jgi:succinate dehydrogenase / fumarate reductase iron-sulfur subunit
MVEQMDLEGFGGCTLYGECQEACPKLISIDTIARMNRDYFKATALARAESTSGGGTG